MNYGKKMSGYRQCMHYIITNETDWLTMRSVFVCAITTQPLTDDTRFRPSRTVGFDTGMDGCCMLPSNSQQTCTGDLFIIMAI